MHIVIDINYSNDNFLIKCEGHTVTKIAGVDACQDTSGANIVTTQRLRQFSETWRQKLLDGHANSVSKHVTTITRLSKLFGHKCSRVSTHAMITKTLWGSRSGCLYGDGVRWVTLKQSISWQHASRVTRMSLKTRWLCASSGPITWCFGRNSTYGGAVAQFNNLEAKNSRPYSVLISTSTSPPVGAERGCLFSNVLCMPEILWWL